MKILARRTKKQAAPVIPEGPPHLIGYARVSTADQNPQMQIEALTAHGVDPRDIYWEKGSGGDIAKRREFQAMMKDARAGDIVVVWKLDRLGRNTRQVLDTIEELDRRGARIRSLTENIDTSTISGRLVMTVLAAVADMERGLARERTIAGLRNAAAQGRKGGRKPLHTLEQLEAVEHLGVREAARRLGITPSGFTKALERERGRAAMKENQK